MNMSAADIIAMRTRAELAKRGKISSIMVNPVHLIELLNRAHYADWQLIRSAPKDGRDIPCIGSTRYNFPVMMRWNREHWRDWNSNICHPTHWFNLPELKKP